MRSSTTRALAVVSTCCFTANVLSYGLSLLGIVPGSVSAWVGLSVVAVLIVSIPIIVVEPALQQSNTTFLRGASFFYWEFARGLPSWVAPVEWALFVIALSHTVTFFAHSGSGIPAIQSGQYVLETHGRILNTLTPTQYRTLSLEAVRMATAMMASFFYVPMMYWWLRHGTSAGKFTKDNKQ